MSSVIQHKCACQEYRLGISKTSHILQNQGGASSEQFTRSDGTAGTGEGLRPRFGGKAYRLNDSQTFHRNQTGHELVDWEKETKEIFSSPSKGLRGENVSVSSVYCVESTKSSANPVTGVPRPAPGLPVVKPESVPVSRGFTLLDYRNTQAEIRAENYKKYFNKKKIENDLYKYKTIRSGDVLEVYEYEGLQVSKKGKKRKDSTKRDEDRLERTEDCIKEIRKKSISRASKHIKRVINANVNKWGHELPKFLTLTFKEDVKDINIANYEFKKFHQRLSYRIGYSLKYTVVVQFQDGERKGGIIGGRGGVIHFHVVLYNMPFIPADELSELWGKGFIKINAIDNVDNLGAYVVGGYLCKKLDDPRYDGQKRYFSSRGLHEPLEIKSKNPIDLGEFKEDNKVYETIFQNEYTGIIHYKQYNLKRRIGKDSIENSVNTLKGGEKKYGWQKES